MSTMDREWMSKSRLSKEYENGVEDFLNFAIAKGNDPKSMSCPCVKCRNLRDHDVKTIRAHLTVNGINIHYCRWTSHGESHTSHTTDWSRESNADRNLYSDEPVDMVHDAYVDNPSHFHKLLEEAEMPLYLYKDCESRNLLDKVRFVNPNPISHNLNVDHEEKANIVIQRLTGTLPNQLILIPCNVGWHWIFMVMDPYNETIYVLDPLTDEAHFKDWMSIMTTVQRKFNMDRGIRREHGPLFKVVKCQQQPDGKQCGFYVMRYMRDIIENCGSDHPIPIPSLFSEGLYTRDEIDEVRTEWAELVHDLFDEE